MEDIFDNGFRSWSETEALALKEKNPSWGNERIIRNVQERLLSLLNTQSFLCYLYMKEALKKQKRKNSKTKV